MPTPRHYRYWAWPSLRLYSNLDSRIGCSQVGQAPVGLVLAGSPQAIFPSPAAAPPSPGDKPETSPPSPPRLSQGTAASLCLPAWSPLPRSQGGRRLERLSTTDGTQLSGPPRTPPLLAPLRAPPRLKLPQPCARALPCAGSPHRARSPCCRVAAASPPLAPHAVLRPLPLLFPNFSIQALLLVLQ